MRVNWERVIGIDGKRYLDKWDEKKRYFDAAINIIIINLAQQDANFITALQRSIETASSAAQDARELVRNCPHDMRRKKLYMERMELLFTRIADILKTSLRSEKRRRRKPQELKLQELKP